MIVGGCRRFAMLEVDGRIRSGDSQTDPHSIRRTGWHDDMIEKGASVGVGLAHRLGACLGGAGIPG